MSIWGVKRWEPKSRLDTVTMESDYSTLLCQSVWGGVRISHGYELDSMRDARQSRRNIVAVRTQGKTYSHNVFRSHSFVIDQLKIQLRTRAGNVKKQCWLISITQGSKIIFFYTVRRRISWRFSWAWLGPGLMALNGQKWTNTLFRKSRKIEQLCITLLFSASE